MLSSGFCLGIILDTYRVLKGRFQIRGWVVSLIDLLYWFVSSGLVFSLLFWSNWGELRFYIFVAIVLGIFLYYQWLSRWMINLIRTCVQMIEWLIHALIRLGQVMIIGPILFVVQLIQRLLSFLWNLIKKICFFILLRPILWLFRPITNLLAPKIQPYILRGKQFLYRWGLWWNQRRKKDDP